eukprot:sb/3468416/
MTLILYAYFALAAIGWRVFFATCAVPFHLISFLLLLCYKDTTSAEKEEVMEKECPPGAVQEDYSFTKTDILVTGLGSCLMFGNIAQKYGLITLLPTVYQEDNIALNENSENCNIVYGGQFLRMVVIHGIGPIMAKGLSYYLLRVYNNSLQLMTGAVLVKLFVFVAITTLPLSPTPRDILFGFVKAMTTAELLLFWIYQTEVISVNSIRTTSGMIIEGISGLGPLLGTTIVAVLPVEACLVFMTSVGALEVASVLMLLCVLK